MMVMLCISSVSAQQKLFWDGYDWQRIDRITAEYPEYRMPIKLAYLDGMLNTKLYYYLITYAADAKVADTVFADFLNHVSPEELVHGTDQFYKDPTNLYLPVISALFVTSITAAGLPDSVIAGYKRDSRQWINNLEFWQTDLSHIKLEGINRPTIPKPPWALIFPDSLQKIRKWYNPRKKLIP